MEKLLRKMGAPPLFNRKLMDELAAEAPLPSKSVFPDAKFSRNLVGKGGRRMPQTIAHRGNKATCPENTMCAFKKAVEVGAHALETDVHLTKDGVVVLSHDATLSRCFGVDKKILDCNWEDLENLRTLKKPHEPLPRLEDLLRYLAQPELSHIWLLLDIKIDNHAENILRLMAETLSIVKAPEDGQWTDRILLGCWAAKFMPYCRRYFPGFSITNIGFSIAYSRQFLSIPNVSFNLIQHCLYAPSGRLFLREAKQKGLPVYVWTVNNENVMDWCIRRALDGVITDDPEKFLDYCDKFDPSKPPAVLPTFLVIEFIRISVFAWLFGLLFRFRYGGFRQQKESTIKVKATK